MIPQYLKLKDFLSYVEEEIDFTTLDPIVLIKGINNEASSDGDNNGAGKSSLLDAIEWVLYGRVRGALCAELVMDDIIHTGEDGESAKFTRIVFGFEMDDGFYEVTRERVFEKSSSLDVKFSKDQKTWVNLTKSPGVNRRTGRKESSIKRTQQTIDDILNANCDLFINANFFEQMNTNTYALSKESGKSDLLRQALYLDKWIDYADHQKQKMKKLEKELAVVEYKVKHNNIDDIKESIKNAKDILKDNKKAILFHKSNLSSSEELKVTLSEELIDAERSLALQSSITELYHSLKSEVYVAGNNVTSCERLLGRSEALIDTYNTNALSISQSHSELSKALLDVSNTLESLEVDTNDYHGDFAVLKHEIGKLEGEVKFIIGSKDDFQGDCPIDSPKCSRNSEEVHNCKIKKINSSIFSMNKKINSKKKELGVLKENINEQVSQSSKMKSLQSSIFDIENEIKTSETDKTLNSERLKTAKDQMEERFSDHENSINVFKDLDVKFKLKKEEFECLENINISSIKSKLNICEDNIVGYRASIQKLDSQSSRVEGSIDVHKEKLKEVAKWNDEFNDMNDKRHTYLYNIKMFSKDIPHQLIEAALPEIEDYAQEYLTILSQGRMNIEMKTQRETKKKDKETKEVVMSDQLHMELEVDGVTKKYALCSGGEKTRADIAIHLAYATFTVNRSGAKIRSLFLDEVGMALDDTGKKALVSLLDMLISKAGFKQIFVISQDEKFNKLFDCTLTVKKTSNGSVICQN